MWPRGSAIGAGLDASVADRERLVAFSPDLADKAAAADITLSGNVSLANGNMLLAAFERKHQGPLIELLPRITTLLFSGLGLPAVER